MQRNWVATPGFFSNFPKIDILLQRNASVFIHIFSKLELVPLLLYLMGKYLSHIRTLALYAQTKEVEVPGGVLPNIGYIGMCGPKG